MLIQQTHADKDGVTDDPGIGGSAEQHLQR